MSDKSVMAVMAIALFITGCGGDGSPPNTTPGSTVAPTTTATSAVAPVEQFAFVRAIDLATITFDPAVMLTGEAAREAAQEAGVIGEGEDLPNDFYIDNPDRATETAGLDPAGTFVLLGFDESLAIAEETVDLGRLVAILSEGSDQFYGIVPGEFPASLTIAGDTVTGLHQVYLP